jgi:hypothetical protein
MKNKQKPTTSNPHNHTIVLSIRDTIDQLDLVKLRTPVYQKHHAETERTNHE